MINGNLYLELRGHRLVVIIPESTGIVWRNSAGNLFGGYHLSPGFVVDGFENRPLYQYRDSLNGEFEQVGITLLNGFANSGEDSFFEKTGYLGFRFEGDDVTHYGSVQLNGKRVWDFEVLSYAYESEPNTAIIMGAVPEPSTEFILMVLPALAWRRVRSDRARWNSIRRQFIEAPACDGIG